MKVLNLYACLGGNRLLWDDCQVTAVELDPELARMYQDRFPDDIVIVADAHQYLLDHYREFDFIWSSPPCPTHSRIRQGQVLAGRHDPKYPDMKLYQEIIFLSKHFKGKYCIENVLPYYDPLIPAQKIGRHLFWANFKITNPPKTQGKPRIAEGDVSSLSEWHGIDLSEYKGTQRKDKIARNLVDYQLGGHIFSIAQGVLESRGIDQGCLF